MIGMVFINWSRGKGNLKDEMELGTILSG